MRRRALKAVAVNGGADFLITGWKADEVIDGAGAGPVWSRLLGGWLIYARDIADLIAYAEVRGVTVQGITREAARDLRASWSEPDRDVHHVDDQDVEDIDLQLSLFDGSR